MSDKPKLCVDCKWSRRNRFFKLLKTLYCGHPSQINPVTGKARRTCDDERMFSQNDCGPDGKLFGPKETK